MKIVTVAAIASAFALAACGGGISDPAPMPADPLTQQLVGKTLTSGEAILELGEGNLLTGRAGPGGEVPIEGAWQIRRGQFCRTLSSPPQLAGTECQDVTIDGGTATFDTPRGVQTYLISES